MKINPISNLNIQKYYQTAKLEPARSAIPCGCDEVTFSDEALSFAKVMAEAEFRTQEEKDHITEIANAVKQGKYRIDSELIADKMLESVSRR